MITESVKANLMGSGLKQKFNLSDYEDIIKSVSAAEYSRMSAKFLADYSEIESLAVQVVIKICANVPKGTYTRAYISTAITWAVRNEMRRRYKWYVLKNKIKGTVVNMSREALREVVYKTVLSVEDLNEHDKSVVINDKTSDAEENCYLNELSDVCKKIIESLPEREKSLVEAKFYSDKKLREISDEYDVSISRASRIIASALDKIKKELIAKGFGL